MLTTVLYVIAVLFAVLTAVFFFTGGPWAGALIITAVCAVLAYALRPGAPRL